MKTSVSRHAALGSKAAEAGKSWRETRGHMQCTPWAVAWTHFKCSGLTAVAGSAGHRLFIWSACQQQICCLSLQADQHMQNLPARCFWASAGRSWQLVPLQFPRCGWTVFPDSPNDAQGLWLDTRGTVQASGSTIELPTKWKVNYDIWNLRLDAIMLNVGTVLIPGWMTQLCSLMVWESCFCGEFCLVRGSSSTVAASAPAKNFAFWSQGSQLSGIQDAGGGGPHQALKWPKAKKNQGVCDSEFKTAVVL